MDLLDFRSYCLSLPEAEEAMPFDERILVFKIGGKIFAACDILHFVEFAVKCDPDRALELREQYPEITPAHHFNNRHWNGIRVDGDLAAEVICREILHSYRQVLYGSVTPKAERLRLIAIYENSML